MTPPPTATESAIQAALDASALTDVYVRLERESDGAVFTATKGAPNARYISSSTVKPITCAALEWAVAQGYLTLDSLAIDLVPEYEALATGEQRNVALRHLMSFTSGLTVNRNPPSSGVATDWQSFVDDVAQLASINPTTNVPGALHTYATDQHALASIMAVSAGAFADWAALLTAFIASTGLFPGLTWTNASGAILGGNVQVNYTAAEYAAFLRAIFAESVLTPTRCQDIYADAIPSNPTRTTSYAWLTGGGLTGEDWHFGRGIWLEQRHADWVGAEGSTRISTIGVGGQYCYHDTATGVTLVVSVTFPATTAEFVEGFAFARSIDALVAIWGAE